MNMIYQFSKDCFEWERFTKVAEMLTAKSPRRYKYYVGDCYFDFGQGWMWTTILCNTGSSSYQALCPREQEAIILAEDDELEEIVDEIFKDKYCPDR